MTLLNFRNYEGLDLDLDPGTVLVQGGNGQGKSNLLEAMYMLAIAKSYRATADRELVRWDASGQEAYAQVAALAHRDGGRVRVQIDFRGTPPPADESQPGPQLPGHQSGEAASVQKYIRVNGVPRRASDLVGEINAVMFSAHDMDMALGSPSTRRRYLDILISQLDNSYLKALQRYQRVISQRNHLLKAVREGRSKRGELDFWDDELISAGSHIMAVRAETVGMLSDTAAPVHGELSDEGDRLQIAYRPSIDVGGDDTSRENMMRCLKSALERQYNREVAQGFTVCGPHRDDLQLLLGGMDVAVYASRGQCRTVVLAMKLAEASYLSDRRAEEPIILLDDVLSELDSTRRSHVLEKVAGYQQCFITTADAHNIDAEHLSRMSRFTVQGGALEAVHASSVAVERRDSAGPRER